jgi:hypothetical protein
VVSDEIEEAFRGPAKIDVYLEALLLEDKDWAKTKFEWKCLLTEW